MHFLRTCLSGFVLLLSVSAVNVPRAELEVRSNVDTCKAILVALKASAFCSSFVPITDITSTVTSTTTTATTTTTSTAPCTGTTGMQKRLVSKTPLAPSSTPTPTMTTTLSTCTVRGLPVGLKSFACAIVTEACLDFVTPRTSTVGLGYLVA